MKDWTSMDFSEKEAIVARLSGGQVYLQADNNLFLVSEIDSAIREECWHTPTLAELESAVERTISRASLHGNRNERR